MHPPVALTIAGSDPSGGAGIQADLKAFSFLHVHGAAVITCVTAQNTQQVTTSYPLMDSLVRQQLETLLDDIKVNAVKTGMLYNASLVKTVASVLKKHDIHPIVDPVMVATSGDSLMQQDFLSALQTHLLPQALMVTANSQEAAALTKKPVTTIEEMKQACKELRTQGPTYVVIKGGHIQGEQTTDVFYDGKKIHEFSLPRIPDHRAHGSGCTHAALITGLHAQKIPPKEAVQKAKHIVWSMIQQGYQIGAGADVLHHNPSAVLPTNLIIERQIQLWIQLQNAVTKLCSFLPSSFIPEVGMNIGYALPNATSFEDICALNGRIIKTKQGPLHCGDIRFGASKHIASVILAAMAQDENIRCAVNIKYSDHYLRLCKKAGFSIGTFNREQEPETASSTMEWGTTEAIRTTGYVPDIIYDKGGVGKEPMIRVLAQNPKNLLRKLQKIIKNE